MSYPITDKVRSHFKRYEGMNQASKVPPGQSGVTLGYGYDLGQTTKAQFLADWGDVLTNLQTMRLVEAIGKKGVAARAIGPTFKDIYITRMQADKVFDKVLLRYAKETEQAFPGIEKYPIGAYWGVVSLEYNRGPSMGKSSDLYDGRQEMRDLREAIANGADCEAIGNIIDGMAYLWQDQNMDGLIARRHAEAEMVKAADDPE